MPSSAQQDELQPLRDNARLAGFCRAAVADGVFEIEQQTRRRSGVGVVHQDRALTEQRLEPLKNHIDRGVEQRMTGREQFGLRLAGDQRLVERDAGIAVEHRIGAADQPVALFEDRRDARDLEPAALALGDPAAEQRETLRGRTR